MSVYTAVGSFATGTGTSDVVVTFPTTVPKFTPKAIILCESGSTVTNSADLTTRGTHQRGMGFVSINEGGTISQMAVGSMSVDNNAGAVTEQCFTDSTNGTNTALGNCVYTITTAAGIDGLASVKSVGAGTFTIQINDAFVASIIVDYIAIGGEDITRTSLTQQFSVSGATNTYQNVNSFGFQPDCVLYICHNGQNSSANGLDADSRISFGACTRNPLANACWGGGSNQGAATTVTQSFVNVAQSQVAFNASVNALTDVGQTQDWSQAGYWQFHSTNVNATGASTRAYLCLGIQGGSYAINYLAGNGTLTSPSIGFNPLGLIFVSHGKVPDATGTTASAVDEWSMGFCDQARNQVASAVSDSNGVTTTNVKIASSTSKVWFHATTAGTINTLTSDGFTFNSGAAALPFGWFLAIGDSPKPPQFANFVDQISS